MKILWARAGTFGAVTVLSWLLLSLFPFYPLWLTLVLGLVLGAVALEFPTLSLLVAVLLDVFGAMYQNQFIGLAYGVIFILVFAFAGSWIEIALLSATWILTFMSPLPYLAIVPVVLAGLHLSRQNAVKIGGLAGISVFLLSWARGLMQAGLMLVPFPASSGITKPIPDPWRFSDFFPTTEMADAVKLGNYFAPLATSIGDYRIYILVAAWAVSAYVIALVSSKWKGPASVGAAIIGLVPVLVVGAVFAQSPPLELGGALVGGAVVTLAFSYIQPRITAPVLSLFTSLDDLAPTGIPRKYALLLGSPACDERNLVVEQFIQAGLAKKLPSFLLTSDTGFARSAASKFEGSLTVILANPRATAEKSIIPLTTGIQNLTGLNIELVRLVKDHAGSGGRVCLDILSDVMLSHKLLTTRKWVTDLLPRLVNWEFTVLGVFNPGLQSTEEVQGLVELFNGYVEIFEKDYAGRARKLAVVRKMADLRYNENELLVDKQQLLAKKGGLAAIRQRLAK